MRRLQTELRKALWVLRKGVAQIKRRSLFELGKLSPCGGLVATWVVHALSKASSLTVSAQNARMPSANFSVAIASMVRARRNDASL